MRFAMGFFAALALLFVAALAIVWTGAYNVAASAGHIGVVRWFLEEALHSSVQSRADEVPAELFRNADVRAGLREFQEYCVHCHGAPGVKTHEWTTGMVPDPPDLSEAAAEWSEREIFWIVKNGIKMTGMPAFGDTESDQTIANIAAFVKRLEGMSPQHYAQLQRQYGAPASGGHSGGGHSHGSEGH